MAIFTLLGGLGLVATAQREAGRAGRAGCMESAARADRAARLEWLGGMLLVVSFVGLGFNLAQASV